MNKILKWIFFLILFTFVVFFLRGGPKVEPTGLRARPKIRPAARPAQKRAWARRALARRARPKVGRWLFGDPWSTEPRLQIFYTPMYFPLFPTLLAMGDLFLFIPEAPTVLPLFEFEFKFKSISSSSYETIQLLTPLPNRCLLGLFSIVWEFKKIILKLL